MFLFIHDFFLLNFVGSSLQIRQMYLTVYPQFLSHPGMVSSVRSYQILKAFLLEIKDHECSNFNAGPISDR